MGFTRDGSDRLSSVETGMLVGVLEWQEDIMQEAGAEFLIMHVRLS